MAGSYVDNAVPFGSRTELIKRGLVAGATEIGTYILESISLSRPSHIIERKDQIGEPNGFVAVKGFDHGTCVIQIPTADSAYPARGDWFVDTFSNTEDEETWVIVDFTEPYAMADYFKCNATLRRATNPP